MNHRDNFALVTGASSGIGEATVAELQKQGWYVFAGRRDAAARSSREEGSAVTPVPLDVADASSIERAAACVDEWCGVNGLAALVHNAGISTPGPLEFLTPADWHGLFAVNFFGPVELTRRLLPALRRRVARCGPGSARLILVSSIGARAWQPTNAPYVTSKAAMSMLGHCLRLELGRQGVAVTVVEPGAIATEIWRKGHEAFAKFSPDHPARELYGREIEGLAGVAQQFQGQAIPASAAGEKIVRCLLAPRAPRRIVVGRDAALMAILQAILPLAWFDALLKRALRL